MFYGTLGQRESTKEAQTWKAFRLGEGVVWPLDNKEFYWFHQAWAGLELLGKKQATSIIQVGECVNSNQ